MRLLRWLFEPMPDIGLKSRLVFAKIVNKINLSILEPVFTAKRDVFLPHLACLLR